VELSAFAAGVVLAETLERKLAPPPAVMTDRLPRPAVLPMAPGRPAELRIQPGRAVKRLPRLEGMRDPRQRGRILHALANHELQAVELYAWAILAYPLAPAAFRQDLLHILTEEQRHTRMYVSRLKDCGLAFGDQAVTGYFWAKVAGLQEHPLRFVCAMALTFENANLDHTLELEAAAQAAGDAATAAVIRRVRSDEVGHVAFGWRWLAAMREADQTMWQAYLHHVRWPLRPALARGRQFNRADRMAAGLDPAFIQLLEAEEPPRPRAQRRSPAAGQVGAGHDASGHVASGHGGSEHDASDLDASDHPGA